MSEKSLAERVVDKMYDEDLFSQWLGIERVIIEEGHCVLKMKVRREMVNGFGIAHGGICFSFADSALAFASNAYGRLSVALECSISFPVAVKVEDTLTCEAKELSITQRTATYLITVKNQKEENVAFFKGTVYRTSKVWFSATGGTDNESFQISGNAKSTDKKSITNSINSSEEPINDSVDKLIFPELSYAIIGCAYDVFNQIGGGHKESVYQKALKESFLKKGLKIEEQIFYKVLFNDKTVGKNFFYFLVDEKIVVEIKSHSRFSKANFDQILNYLHVSKMKLAMLISFTQNQVEVKRVVNFDLVENSKKKN